HARTFQAKSAGGLIRGIVIAVGGISDLRVGFQFGILHDPLNCLRHRSDDHAWVKFDDDFPLPDRDDVAEHARIQLHSLPRTQPAPELLSLLLTAPVRPHHETDEQRTDDEEGKEAEPSLRLRWLGVAED